MSYNLKLATELEALAGKATPGRWRHYRFESELIVVDKEDPQRVVASGRTIDDAALIVALVNNLPAITAALRAAPRGDEETVAQQWAREAKVTAVARAIHAARYQEEGSPYRDHPPLEESGQRDNQYCYRLARAAIAAMGRKDV